MKKVICTVESPCYHPATGLDLVPGEMRVTDEAAAVLKAAGLARDVSEVRVKDEKPGLKKEKKDA